MPSFIDCVIPHWMYSSCAHGIFENGVLNDNFIILYLGNNFIESITVKAILNENYHYQNCSYSPFISSGY